MSSTQTASTDTHAPTAHRLFTRYDPEVVAVMVILLGSFQLILAAAASSIITEIEHLFICPLCVGSLSVIAGSLGLVSERTPNRRILKSCLFAGLAGLGGTLIALFLYSYAVGNLPHYPPCEPDELYDLPCPQKFVEEFYKSVCGQLLFYDIAALTLLCFLTSSAFKGLKLN